MNFLKSYNLFESILYASDDLNKILKSINTSVGEELQLILQDKKDIKTNYNLLDISDKNDEIHFVGDAKAQKLISDNHWDFGKSKQTMKIGRIVRTILKDNNIYFTDKDIEEFVDLYKSKYNSIYNEEQQDNIRLVHGDEIRYWYNSSTYEQFNISNTELGKSCMRYAHCGSYFGIYTDNPRECQLLICVNDSNELIGRALFWRLSTPKGCYLLDRCYSKNSEITAMMIDWVSKNIPDVTVYCHHCYKIPDENRFKPISGTLEVALENGGYETFPYVDTLDLYSPYDHTLSNSSGDYRLDSQSGGYTDENGVYCEFEDETFPQEDVIYSDYHQVSMLQDNAVYSEYFNSWIWDGDSVYSEKLSDNLPREESEYSKYYKSYIPKDDSVEAIVDTDGNTDFFVKKDIDSVIVEDDFLSTYYDAAYYLNDVDLVVEIKNNSFAPVEWVIDAYTTTDTNGIISELDAEIKESVSVLNNVKFEIDEDSKIQIDQREYYHNYIFINGVDYDKAIEELESYKDAISTDLYNRKLEELNDIHNYFKKIDNKYSEQYDIKKFGGKENIKKLISERILSMKDKDLSNALRNCGMMSFAGNWYFFSVDEFNNDSDTNKIMASKVLVILKKLLPQLIKCLDSSDYSFHIDSYGAENDNLYKEFVKYTKKYSKEWNIPMEYNANGLITVRKFFFRLLKDDSELELMCRLLQ